jgi:hypothetical protein
MTARNVSRSGGADFYRNSRTIAYFALKYTDRRLSTIGRGGNDCRMISRLGGEMRLKMLSSGAEPRLLSARSSSSDGLFPGAKSHFSSFICKTRLSHEKCEDGVAYIVKNGGPMG